MAIKDIFFPNKKKQSPHAGLQQIRVVPGRGRTVPRVRGGTRRRDGAIGVTTEEQGQRTPEVFPKREVFFYFFWGGSGVFPRGFACFLCSFGLFGTWLMGCFSYVFLGCLMVLVVVLRFLGGFPMFPRVFKYCFFWVVGHLREKFYWFVFFLLGRGVFQGFCMVNL